MRSFDYKKKSHPLGQTFHYLGFEVHSDLVVEARAERQKKKLVRFQ